MEGARFRLFSFRGTCFLTAVHLHIICVCGFQTPSISFNSISLYRKVIHDVSCLRSKKKQHFASAGTCHSNRISMTTEATFASGIDAPQQLSTQYEPMPSRKFIPVDGGVAGNDEQCENKGDGIRIISYNILGPWQALTDKHNYRCPRSPRSRRSHRGAARSFDLCIVLLRPDQV